MRMLKMKYILFAAFLLSVPAFRHRKQSVTISAKEIVCSMIVYS